MRFMPGGEYRQRGAAKNYTGNMVLMIFRAGCLINSKHLFAHFNRI